MLSPHLPVLSSKADGNANNGSEGREFESLRAHQTRK